MKKRSQRPDTRPSQTVRLPGEAVRGSGRTGWGGVRAGPTRRGGTGGPGARVRGGGERARLSTQPQIRWVPRPPIPFWKGRVPTPHSGVAPATGLATGPAVPPQPRGSERPGPRQAGCPGGPRPLMPALSPVQAERGKPPPGFKDPIVPIPRLRGAPRPRTSPLLRSVHIHHG